ncbi:MAG: hypothetical protein AB1715_11460, partial [Acidobacteriota bacterium]
ARLVARDGLGRFAADYYNSLNGMYAAENAEKLSQAYRHVLNVTTHSAKREIQAILSTRALVKDAAVESEIAAFGGHLESAQISFPKDANLIYKKLCRNLGATPQPLALTEAERPLARVVPVRDEGFVCPLSIDYLVEKLGPGVLNELALRGDAAYEALNFVDGKRTVQEIALAISAEFGPQNSQHVYDFFSVLERAGLVRLKKV